MTRAMVIGIGNTLRGDDAAGLVVADRLRDHVPEGVEVVGCDQEPVSLIDAWQDADAVVLVDAVVTGAEPGTVLRVDASDGLISPRAFRSSTHAFGIGETIELARALGKLPRRVIIYGIEGTHFEARPMLTAPVADAIEKVAESILAELGSAD